MSSPGLICAAIYGLIMFVYAFRTSLVRIKVLRAAKVEDRELQSEMNEHFTNQASRAFANVAEYAGFYIPCFLFGM
jgi:MAPEG family